MFCPSCGTQNEDTAALCAKCHKNLKAVASPAPAATKKKEWWQVVSPRFGWGCLALIVFFTLASLPTISNMSGCGNEKAAERSVEANMHTLRLAAEDFARQADSINPVYPISPASAIPNGTTFKSFWPSNMKNPYNANDDVVVVVDKEPDWDEIKEGQVVYMPRGITKKGAAGYVITGKGKKPLGLKLTSGE